LNVKTPDSFRKKHFYTPPKQIDEVARWEPSNQRLQALTVKRFFKLVRRKFGITDSKDEEGLGRALTGLNGTSRFRRTAWRPW
jgi:hypothetical protein